MRQKIKRLSIVNVIESLADPSQSKQRSGKYLRNGTKPGKAHTEPLKNILAAEKMVPLTAGSTPVGRGGRGIIKLWGLLVLLSLPWNGITNPCLKSYQNVKYGWTTARAFAANTHINAGCYEPGKLETCTIGEKSYWVATNSGMGEWAPQNYQFCPRGEPFLCFTKGGMWGYSDKGGVHDKFKEELVKKVTKNLREIQTKKEQEQEVTCIKKLRKDSVIGTSLC